MTYKIEKYDFIFKINKSSMTLLLEHCMTLLLEQQIYMTLLLEQQIYAVFRN